MDLLERGLCESHTKVPCESMIEPEGEQSGYDNDDDDDDDDDDDG